MLLKKRWLGLSPSLERVGGSVPHLFKYNCFCISFSLTISYSLRPYSKCPWHFDNFVCAQRWSDTWTCHICNASSCLWTWCLLLSAQVYVENKYSDSWQKNIVIYYYMSGVPKDIYCYSFENSFTSDWAETFFLHVLDP